MGITQIELLRELQRRGLVQLNWEGRWIVTRKGRRTIALVDLLREMVNSGP